MSVFPCSVEAVCIGRGRLVRELVEGVFLGRDEEGYFLAIVPLPPVIPRVECLDEPSSSAPATTARLDAFQAGLLAALRPQHP